MMQVVSVETSDLYPGALVAQYRLRQRIFNDRLGWKLRNWHGLEFDQFDTPAATYLVWRGDTGEAHGVARLIPTTEPYMLQQVWPELCRGELPADAAVWEGSRFGVDHSLPAAMRDQVGRELIVGCLEFGVTCGIREYMVLMPTFVVRRLIGGAGCNYRILSRSRQFGQVEMCVARVRVDAETLASARSLYGCGELLDLAAPAASMEVAA